MSGERTLQLRGLLTSQGWVSDPIVTLSESGALLGVDSKSQNPIDAKINGYALPGFYNGHSHAFQYALGGLVENLAPGQEGDDFWSWRNKMYELALSIGPEELEEIGFQLYSEMRRKGYRQVTEFHYLHHQQDGQRYANLAETAEALIRAAERSRMKITVVPVYYRAGGFAKEATAMQRRFLFSNLDEYWRLVESVQSACQKSIWANYGVGVHSLRAASAEEVIELFNAAPSLVPKHIHIAEQVKEVDESQQVLGARPVEWLLANVDVDERFSLVHATHLTKKECEDLAESGANVVLCPSTEANLGDGFFPFVDYRRQKGRWTIGSDSHASVDPLEELRWLDYGQRLLHQKRNIVCQEGGEDSGNKLYHEALLGGHVAAGDSGELFLAVGQKFDPIIVSAESARFSHGHLDRILSTLIYSPGDRPLIEIDSYLD